MGVSPSTLRSQCLGPWVVESPLMPAFHPSSGFDVIWNEWLASVLIAGGLGFSVQRIWQGAAARWSWVIPSTFFIPWFILHIPGGHVVSRLSGYGCAVQLGGLDCREFFRFTIPLVRGVAYSATSLVAVRIQFVAQVSRQVRVASSRRPSSLPRQGREAQPFPSATTEEAAPKKVSLIGTGT